METVYDPVRALELLRLGVGRGEADWRLGQEDAVRHTVEGLGRLLVVQKTGWGKSFVYFIATKLLREAGHGPALLVSPLLALMRNQIDAAARMGVRAVTINSANQDDWSEIEAKIALGEVDILLVSPERLANERFRLRVMSRIAAQIALLVIDEAHCISDWGHDFRPHYRQLERIVRALPPNLRVLGTTATANQRVIEDLGTVMGPNLRVTRGDLCRPSLTLQTIRMPGQAERLAWLAEHVTALPGHGIVYALTVRDANLVAEWLQSKGLAVEAYTSDTGERREGLERALLENQVKALVATTALGMGYDKPDLAFVIHYQCPGSVVAYYQQVGRAGRALPRAYGVLLGGEEDSDIVDWFIASAFPTPEEVAAVLLALEEEPEGLSLYGLMARVNLSSGRIDKTLALLALESPSPIAKQDGKWQLTASVLGEAFWDRADRLIALRRKEQKQMQEYVDLPFGEHMPYLVAALDGEADSAAQPGLPPLPEVASPALVQDALGFLRRCHLPIEPRRKWPAGGMPHYGKRGNLAESETHRPGMALCSWSDSGWGELVRRGKGLDGVFAEELVEACVEMFKAWGPAPQWVTCVPSLRHPRLVPDFAQRLADALGLPFHEVLCKTADRPEQKTMANSTQQARNLDGSLEIVGGDLPGSPVLLVDDIVDSRWTLTVCAWLLRSHGCSEVFPLALAAAGRGV